MINFYKKACPQYLKPSFYRRGITAIEILLVVGIIGILSLIVFPQFSKIKENQVLKNTVENVVSTLHNAQSKSLASLDSSEYGVYFQSDQIIVFKGTSFIPDTVGNEVMNIVTPATISNVTLNSVSDISGEIYFNRLSGSPSKTGTITISTSSFSKIITIYSTGAVSVD
ncbi:hypothetical protein CO033_00995 [Candidatus Nomurabacteria bacterium CG_4_9_14_0_2_um_filter_32_10]|uniref:General secretion pathway GspH domain-containing protein n=3 Tax=Candidatus Nomuraibacteriota TaxID=1752729 RepID=A0A2H0CI56_9BACT|nr:MAG: hypothetical protein COW91_01570 [Candidatus Nomurabacteria bacterium CG22_combo_CG10-13_8_21_14_all_32_8]PIZ85392.1 MAG: hypothetical protein COX94_02715 [Candidatus Nomurabacteria bacterium CG_4_10_14_0_2_um_filter_33_9]PJC49574.1 MAG: hypothetical protein CO033_00995 [Candidatus Nomurabacteria bacterium CG_4_9_14_0_2_um_filter_32_10]